MPNPRPTPNPGRKPSKRRRERPGRPACPDWIDPEAKEVWARVTAVMREMDVITRADANALARYCQTFVRWKRAEQFIQQRGEIYPCKSNMGIVKMFMPFPQVGIAQKLSALLTKMERDLGLNPASRERIGRCYQNFDDPEGQARDRRRAEEHARWEAKFRER